MVKQLTSLAKIILHWALTHADLLYFPGRVVWRRWYSWRWRFYRENQRRRRSKKVKSAYTEFSFFFPFSQFPDRSTVACLSFSLSTSPLCSSTSPLCSSTSPLCSSTSPLCSSTSPLCSSTSPLCSSTSPLCSSTSEYWDYGTQSLCTLCFIAERSSRIMLRQVSVWLVFILVSLVSSTLHFRNQDQDNLCDVLIFCFVLFRFDPRL